MALKALPRAEDPPPPPPQTVNELTEGTLKDYEEECVEEGTLPSQLTTEVGESEDQDLDQMEANLNHRCGVLETKRNRPWDDGSKKHPMGMYPITMILSPSWKSTVWTLGKTIISMAPYPGSGSLERHPPLCPSLNWHKPGESTARSSAWISLLNRLQPRRGRGREGAIFSQSLAVELCFEKNHVGVWKNY